MPLVQQGGVVFVPVTARPDLVRPLEQATQEAIESALILCEGNRTLAAKRLGIGLRRMYRIMESWRDA